MDRRTWLLGSLGVLAPLAVEAQQAAKIPRIGYLAGSLAASPNLVVSENSAGPEPVTGPG
jgi:hypothetical protein